ncbi:hypothetical protein GE21DRAFT_2704 [Neurospora crassa]|nr:hypothetical protein GE21DRAFT_2704 [Neurospora crassa]
MVPTRVVSMVDRAGRHHGVQMTYKPLADRRLQAVLYEAPQACYTDLVPLVRRDAALGNVKCAMGVFGTCTPRYSCSIKWCNMVEAFGCMPASVTKVAWYCIRTTLKKWVQ